MSLINTEVKPFKATAFHNGKFVDVTEADLKGKWSLYVVNSPMHQELRKLFAGTKWATGGWSVVLRRLPGGEESTQRIGAGLGAAKVTVVDVPEHLLSAGNEDNMLLAA